MLLACIGNRHVVEYPTCVGIHGYVSISIHAPIFALRILNRVRIGRKEENSTNKKFELMTARKKTTTRIKYRKDESQNPSTNFLGTYPIDFARSNTHLDHRNHYYHCCYHYRCRIGCSRRRSLRYYYLHCRCRHHRYTRNRP